MLQEYLVNGGVVTPLAEGYRLNVPSTADMQYVDAQLDDYAKVLPMRFAHAPPQGLQLEARFSHPVGWLKGTAGFGFWNHPFGQAGQVLASPCNVWFFYGSPESNLQVKPGASGHGFKAATLSSPPLPSGNGRVARFVNGALDRVLQLPLLARLAMATAQRMVQAHECLLEIDITQWHRYEIDWQNDSAVFRVDGREVLRAPKPPRGPLGLVIWLDNYKAIAADGRYEFGYVGLTEPQWMEVRGITMKSA